MSLGPPAADRTDDRPNAFGADVRAAARARDGHRCVWCGWDWAHCTVAASPAGAAARLTVDHVVPVHFGGSGTLDNAQVLCDACHEAKSACELVYTRGVLVRYTGGSHPGGGKDGWYVRARDAAAWADAWTLGPRPTALEALVVHHRWARRHLRALARRGWTHVVARRWLAHETPRPVTDPGWVAGRPSPFDPARACSPWSTPPTAPRSPRSAEAGGTAAAPRWPTP